MPFVALPGAYFFDLSDLLELLFAYPSRSKMRLCFRSMRFSIAFRMFVRHKIRNAKEILCQTLQYRWYLGSSLCFDFFVLFPQKMMQLWFPAFDYKGNAFYFTKQIAHSAFYLSYLVSSLPFVWIFLQGFFWLPISAICFIYHDARN